MAAPTDPTAWLDAAVEAVMTDETIGLCAADVRWVLGHPAVLARLAAEYERGLRDAAGVAEASKAAPCQRGYCTCWPTCEAKPAAAPEAIADAILALVPKESPHDR